MSGDRTEDQDAELRHIQVHGEVHRLGREVYFVIEDDDNRLSLTPSGAEALRDWLNKVLS